MRNSLGNAQNGRNNYGQKQFAHNSSTAVVSINFENKKANVWPPCFWYETEYLQYAK